MFVVYAHLQESRFSWNVKSLVYLLTNVCKAYDMDLDTKKTHLDTYKHNSIFDSNGKVMFTVWSSLKQWW